MSWWAMRKILRGVSKVSCKCQILQRPLKEWPRFMALAFLIVLYRALISTYSQANHNPTKAHRKKKKKHPTKKSTPLLFQRGKKKIINLQTEYWKFKYQTAETSWFINCTPYIFHKPIHRRNNKKTAVYNEFVVKVHTAFMWCSASFYPNWINFFS